MKKQTNTPQESASRVKAAQQRVKMPQKAKAPTMGKGAKKRNIKVTNFMSNY